MLDTLGAWESQQKRADQFREARKLRAFTEAVPRMLLARAALRCGAACRALRYVEQHADETARATPQEFNLSKGEARRELPADEVALLHAAYGRIDEPDAFVGLGRMRSATSLVEEVRELQHQGRYSAAVSCYQTALQQQQFRQQAGIPEPPPAPHRATPPTAEIVEEANAPVELHLGLCRCLRYLGHFSLMRHSAEAALTTAAAPAERQQLASAALQAAWRLGEWPAVERLLDDDALRPPPAAAFAAAAASDAATQPNAAAAAAAAAAGLGGGGGGGGAEVRFETALARAMLALHARDAGAIDAECAAARRALAPAVAAAAMESYHRAYPHAVQLQLLHELQSAAAVLIAKDTDDGSAALVELLGHWRTQLPLLCNAPHALEPVIAVRVGVLRDVVARAPTPEVRRLAAEGVGSCWLTFAACARAAGYTETARHALMEAGASDGAAAAYQLAKLEWEDGRQGEALGRLHQLHRTLRDAPGAGGGRRRRRRRRARRRGGGGARRRRAAAARALRAAARAVRRRGGRGRRRRARQAVRRSHQGGAVRHVGQVPVLARPLPRQPTRRRASQGGATRGLRPDAPGDRALVPRRARGEGRRGGAEGLGRVRDAPPRRAARVRQGAQARRQVRAALAAAAA